MENIEDKQTDNKKGKDEPEIRDEEMKDDGKF